MALEQNLAVAAKQKNLAKPPGSPTLQRACACGKHTGSGGECAECRKKRLGLQRQTISEAGPGTAPPIVHEVLRSSGQPLDAKTRAFMEPRIGHDFSQVRLHTDSSAAESARAVNALAYTVGRQIVFGAGQYAPSTGPGQRLLAHELTHVAQQAAVSTSGVEQIGHVDSLAEREAASNSIAFPNGHPATPLQLGPTPILMRQTEHEETESGEEEESPGFWGTIGGGLLGEFNEDPSFAMIGVDLGLSLIPILDQASDARDIGAHLYFMIWRNQYNVFMRWVGLIFSLIGLVPEVGSAIKGASKFVIRGIREVLSHLSDILRPFRRFLPELTDLNRLLRYVSENWNRWVAMGIAAWDSVLGRVTRAVDTVSILFSRRVQFIRDALNRIRDMAPEKLRDGFAWARQKWDEISQQLAERLGRREGAAGAEASADAQRKAALAERGYQTQINRAITDAEEQARRRGRNLIDSVQNPINRRWIEADPRHRQLAFDPARRRLTDQSVAEARAALLVENMGTGTPPFRRNLLGGSGQADFIDGANVHWDHYMPPGINITNEVNSLFGKLTTSTQNVIFDAAHIDPIYRRRLIRQLSDRLASEGRSDLLDNIVVIGTEISQATRRAVRTARIAGRVFEEDEEPVETTP